MKRMACAVALAIACSASRPAPEGPATTRGGEPVAANAVAASSGAAKPDAGNPGAAPQVTLLFAASTAGTLVPCGCSPDQRGGLPRAVALVNKVRADAPNALYIDAGDLLFERDTRPNAQVLPQKEAKARTLARGEELLGAAARAIGPRDLALGKEFVVETAGGVPLLDAGGAPVPQAKASLLLDAGGVQVGVFAAGLGESPEKTIAARAAELRARGARLVVLIVQPRGDNAFAAAQALVARATGVDFAVLGRRDDPAVDANRKEAGPPPLLAVEGDGQSILRVDVRLGTGTPQLVKGEEDKQAELKALDARIERFRSQAQSNPERAPQLNAKVAELVARREQLANGPGEALPAGSSALKATFIPLTKEVGEDAGAAKVVAAYDERVAQMNLADAQRQPERCPRARNGEPELTGVQSCVECHKDAAAFWTQTRHAHAYATLVKVHKELSLDCIRCHVTGWQQPNGVCRIDRTALQGGGFGGTGVGRQDVQCEACHGAGSAHAEAGDPRTIVAAPGETVCLRCHEAANSPHFDFTSYRPYIVGPGHGAPLARGENPHPQKSGSPLDHLAR